MNPEIKKRCKHLLTIITEYSDCWSCGQVIREKTLLVPDELNPGRYRSDCPQCRHETMKNAFPPGELRHLFEMLTELAETDKPILVLVLLRTIFEVMIEGLLYRMMERRFTPGEVCESVMDRMSHQTKLGMISDITGQKLKDIAKDAGYPDLTSTIENLTSRRNSFLHDGIITKPQRAERYGKFQYFKSVPLDDEDVLKAINFAIEIIKFFAKTYSDYGYCISPFEE